MNYKLANGLLADADRSPAENVRRRYDLKRLTEEERLRRQNELVAESLGGDMENRMRQLEKTDFQDANTFEPPLYQDGWKQPLIEKVARENAPVHLGTLNKNMPQTPIQPQEKFVDPVKAQQIEADRLSLAKEQQRNLDHQNESWLTRLKQSAREKFTDPTSMALLQGGLTMANPNSYYDPKGFYSVAEGLNRGLGQGVKTFRQLSKPIEPSFQDQQALIHKNKMEQIGLSNQGRVPSLINSYNMAKAQGFKGTLLDYQVMLKQAGRAVTNINMPGETHGSKKFDEASGKGIAEYMLTGGATDSMKQMAQLQDVSNDLNLIAQGKSEKNLTGAILGLWPKGIRSFWNPESVNTQDLVEEVVQRNLKAILGAQFAKTEGEQLIERAYNPKLEESINAPRIARLLQQMKLAHEQKQAMVKHFMQFKTMDGFKGHIPTMEDFTKLPLDNPNYNYTPQTQGGGVVFTDKDKARQKELRKIVGATPNKGSQ